MEDQRGRGRLAGAGRTEQREMLAEQGIDQQRGARGAGRMNRPDLDMRNVAGAEDSGRIGTGYGPNWRAGSRIFPFKGRG